MKQFFITVLNIFYVVIEYTIKYIMNYFQTTDLLILLSNYKVNTLLGINYSVLNTSDELAFFKSFLDQSYCNINKININSSCLDNLDYFIDTNYVPILFKFFCSYLNFRNFNFNYDYVFCINNIENNTIGIFNLQLNSNITFNKFYKILFKSRYI